MTKRYLPLIMAILIAGSFIVPAFAQQIDSISESPFDGTIEGSIFRHSNTPSSGSASSNEEDSIIPASGIEILLDGPVQYKAVTDVNGKYLFSGVPNGKYEVSIISEIYGDSETIEVLIESNAPHVLIEDVFLGSTYYMFAGINDYNAVYFGEYCMKYMHNAFSNYNVLAKATDRFVGEEFIKADFIDYFKNIGTLIDSRDTFVFYYYGTVYENELDGKIYLSCRDSVISNGKPDFQTMISAEEISSVMNEYFINEPNTFFILEGAYTDEFAKELMRTVDVPLGILAAAYGGMWFEVSNVDNGLMSHGLRLSIDINIATQTARCDLNNDGCVTIGEMVSGVQEFVSLYTIFISQEVSYHANAGFRDDAKFFKHLDYDFSEL